MEHPSPRDEGHAGWGQEALNHALEEAPALTQSQHDSTDTDGDPTDRKQRGLQVRGRSRDNRSHHVGSRRHRGTQNHQHGRHARDESGTLRSDSREHISPPNTPEQEPRPEPVEEFEKSCHSRPNKAHAGPRQEQR